MVDIEERDVGCVSDSDTTLLNKYLTKEKTQ